MCLAIPARVEQLIADNSAIVNLGGVRKEISLALVEDVTVGDYVIVHVGYALQKLDEEEALRTLELFAELGAMNDLSCDSPT
ncbi:MAG: HypC/HybG/HupF family hydrogenase formation chaperone [Gallionella sp.]|jgi:hydrogenase expression/formation protein HypC